MPPASSDSAYLYISLIETPGIRMSIALAWKCRLELRSANRKPRDELDLLALEVIVEARQLLVELGANRADVARAGAAEQLVQLGERGVVERAVGLVDVDA